MNLETIQSFRMNEGSLESPFILTDTEVDKLVTLAQARRNGNNGIVIEGVYNTQRGIIDKSKSYIIKQAFQTNFTLLATETSEENWSVQFDNNLSYATIMEGQSVGFTPIKIAAESLVAEVKQVTLTATANSYTEADVRANLIIDTKNKTVSYKAPDSNAEWQATIVIEFHPVFDASSTKEITLYVNAVAVKGITLSSTTDTVDPGKTCNITATPFPANHTKSNNITYGFKADVGTLQSSPIDPTAIFTAPSEKGQATITASFYMFGSPNVEGTATHTINIDTLQLLIGFDEEEPVILEGTSKQLHVSGYNLSALDFQITVEDFEGEELEATFLSKLSIQDGYLVYATATTNKSVMGATLIIEAKVKGEDWTTEDTTKRAQCRIVARAIAVSSIGLNTTILGEGLTSTVVASAYPENHTKGNVDFYLTSSDATIIRKQNTFTITPKDGVSSVSATLRATVDFMQSGTSLMTKAITLPVLPSDFTVSVETVNINEGGKTKLNTTGIGIENLKHRIRNIIVQSGDNADEIKSLLANRVSIVNGYIEVGQAQENLDWRATVQFGFIPAYATWEDYESPVIASVNISAKAVQRINLYVPAIDDYAVDDAPPIPMKEKVDMKIQVEPADHTKGSVTYSTFKATSEEGYEATTGGSRADRTLTFAYDGKYVVTANVKIVSFPFSATRTINAYHYTSVLLEQSNPLWERGGDYTTDEQGNKHYTAVERIVATNNADFGTFVLAPNPDNPDEFFYAKLDPSNHAKFVDNTDYDGTYGDVFRHLPRVYYKCIKRADGNQVLYISDMPISDLFFEESWIGTYKATVQDNQLRSKTHNASGVLRADGSKTMTDYWNLAQARSKYYFLTNYDHHRLLNALHLCLFGNANSETTIGIGLGGAGNSDTYYNPTLGVTIKIGDKSSTPQQSDCRYPYGTNLFQNKFIGIEAPCGSQWEFCPGIRFEAARAYIYDGKTVSDNAQDMRDNTGFFCHRNLSQNYVTKMVLGKYFDLVPATNNVSGNSTTFWCDGAWATTTGRLLLVGGASSFGSFGGLACSSSSDAFSHAHASIGARLAFDRVSGSGSAALTKKSGKDMKSMNLQ